MDTGPGHNALSLEEIKSQNTLLAGAPGFNDTSVYSNLGKVEP
jgi:hypothetical protein